MGKILGSKFYQSPPDIGARLGLASLITCASVATFSTGAYADTAAQKSQRVNARLSTSAVSISVDDTVNIEVIPSTTGTLAVGKSTVQVNTDALGGYQLYISGLNAEADGLTALYYNNRVDGASKLTGIAGSVPTEFTTANQWGYAVGGDTFSEESAYNSAVASGSISDRSVISSLKWRGLGKDLKLVRSAADADPTNVYFGVYVNNDMMTGNYQNSVVYTAFVEGANKLEIYPTQLKDGDTMTITAEYLSSALPVTESSQIAVSLLNGNASVGTCDNVNITSNGSGSLLEFTCQVHTNSNFAKNNLYDVAVELSHEGKSDKVAFRANEAWGDLQTLADFETMQDATAIACKNSPVNTTYHLKDSRDQKSYLVTRMADGNCWMTQNLALAGGTTITPANSNVKADYTLPTSSTSGFSNNNVAYMYNGSTHKDNTANNKDNHTGAYYSWLTAIAKNDGNYSSADMTALETAGAEATYSICPKGWRLPLRDNGMIAVKNMYSLAEFRALWNQGQTGSAPLFGYYNNGSLNNSGVGADWWSRESNSATYARNVYQNSSGFNTGNNGRYSGYSVRCVLETDHTFQNFSTEDAGRMAEGEVRTLVDTRDNKSYLVAKLKDGNVWMVQNLALAGGTTITPEDSDVKADYTLPSSSTSGFSDSTKQYMHGGVHIDNTANNKDDNSGAYYSWLTAIAKNDSNYSADDMTALEADSAEASYSICPKGWRLPLRDNGMMAVKNMYTLDEFRALWNQGQTGTAPLVGDYLDSLHRSSGLLTYWWSRESSSAESARSMRQNGSGFDINSYNRYGGLSVRCIYAPSN